MGVLVEYGPGGYSPPYACEAALIYPTVLEGANLSAVNGGEAETFTAGQTFTELPGDRHDVSAYTSRTAKLLKPYSLQRRTTLNP